MARNRQIKVEFWNDEKIAKLSFKARLLFIGTWNFADDTGVCRANSVYLRNHIFPYDNISVKDTHCLLTECVQQGLIKLTQSNNEEYLVIINFPEHQKINRPSSFRYIKNLDISSLTTHCGLTDDSLLKEKGNVKGNVKGKGNELSALQALWNEICGLKINKVLANSKDRQAKERLRLKEREYNSWDDIFVKILHSKFCCGENDRNWKASYDWIMSNETNALKVLEGKYTGANSSSGSPEKSQYEIDKENGK